MKYDKIKEIKIPNKCFACTACAFSNHAKKKRIPRLRPPSALFPPQEGPEMKHSKAMRSKEQRSLAKTRRGVGEHNIA